MKCRCGADIPIFYNVLLCDPCIDKEIASVKLQKQHIALGESGPDIKDVPSVIDLEFTWNLN